MNYYDLAKQAEINQGVQGCSSSDTTYLHQLIDDFRATLADWEGFTRVDAYRDSARIALAGVAIEALSMLRDAGTTQWDFREGLTRKVRIFAAPETIVLPLVEYAKASQLRDTAINLELLVVTCNELAKRLFGETIHDVVNARLEAK